MHDGFHAVPKENNHFMSKGLVSVFSFFILRSHIYTYFHNYRTKLTDASQTK